MSDLFLKLFPVVSAAISLLVLFMVVLRFQQFARAAVKPAPESAEPASTVLASLKWEIASMAERLSSLESEQRESLSSVSVRSGMNLNKRTQALRQYRLGQGADSIAKSLEMPKAEVDLLLKVHRIVSSNA